LREALPTSSVVFCLPATKTMMKNSVNLEKEVHEITLELYRKENTQAVNAIKKDDVACNDGENIQY
jgi:hypothetical protein